MQVFETFNEIWIRKSYAVAIDPSGKINWGSNHIDSDHIIAVLTERVSSGYLAFLQSKEVSYLFGGKAGIDLGKVLEKLAKDFKIKKLLLEGGGKINGAMLRAGLIDELSLLVAPVADGSIGAPRSSMWRSRAGKLASSSCCLPGRWEAVSYGCGTKFIPQR